MTALCIAVVLGRIGMDMDMDMVIDVDVDTWRARCWRRRRQTRD
jgi:hypothetical protein